MRPRRHRLAFALLLALIVAAHAALWLSPNMAAGDKLRLTLINAGIWAVVLLPAVGVTLWARAHRGQSRGDEPGGRTK